MTRPTVAREIAGLVLLATACVCLVLLAVHAIDDRRAPLGSFASPDYSHERSSGVRLPVRPATCFDGDYNNDHGKC